MNNSGKAEELFWERGEKLKESDLSGSHTSSLISLFGSLGFKAQTIHPLGFKAGLKYRPHLKGQYHKIFDPRFFFLPLVLLKASQTDFKFFVEIAFKIGSLVYCSVCGDWGVNIHKCLVKKKIKIETVVTEKIN